MPEATANELLRDAIVRRQIAVQRFSKTLSNDVLRLLNKSEKDIVRQLNARLQVIVGRGFDTGPDTTRRLKLLAQSIKDIRTGAVKEMTAEWSTQLRDLAKAEQQYLATQYQQASPVELDLLLPHAATVGAIASTEPFHGEVMKDWASKLARSDSERIMQQVRVGLTQGDGIDAIARRIVGTRGANGTNGITQITRNAAESITRTAVNFVTNRSRSEFFKANADVFSKEQYVATLDANTTIECAELDGQIFPVGEGPIPPIHWNCRSTRVAILDAKAIGNRPAKGVAAADLEGMTKAEQRSTIRSMTGTVPASTTYSEFLGRQSSAFQNEVLGATRAKLFRDGGLTLDKFTDRNRRTVTLDELRSAEPAAFKRAGV